MKNLIAIAIVLCSLSTMADTAYNVGSGKWHYGRSSEFSVSINNSKASTEGTISISLQYYLKCKRIGCNLAGDQRGIHTIELPALLSHEQGYLALERLGRIDFKNYEIIHQGRHAAGRYLDAHKILIQKKTGRQRAKIVAYYHPMVEDAGWVIIVFTKYSPDYYQVLSTVKE